MHRNAILEKKKKQKIGGGAVPV